MVLSGHDRPSDHFDDLRDDGVSEGGKTVHPAGKPIASSANHGFRYIGSASEVLTPSDILAPRKCLEPSNRFREDPLFSFLPRVGNNPDAVASVRGTNGRRRDAIPFRVVPALGQASENSAHPPTKQRCNVFHDDVFRSYSANDSEHVEPQPAAVAFNARASAGVRKILAREPTTNNVGSSAPRFAVKRFDVVMYRHLRPMLPQHGPAVRFDLAEANGRHPGPLKAEAETADAGEQVENSQTASGASARW